MRQPALGIAPRVLGIAVVGACRVSAFVCEDDADCAGGGAVGICEAVGACSFVDDECPSGRRFGDRSPGDLAGECVDLAGTSGSSTLGDDGPESGVSTTDLPTTWTTIGDDTTDGDDGCPDDWWDCAWSRRIALDLPATASETLTDVPVLVALGVPRIDPSEVGPGGADLRFVTSEGARVAHEIERWDPTGTSIVWIAVPSLGPDDGPRLWLYYGNASADDDQDPDGVWSPEHAAVWHLQPGVLDSSGNGNDGIASDGVSDVAGHLAGAKEFFAVDDRIDVPAADVLADVFLAGGTVSAWVRPDTFGGTARGRIADKTAGVAGGWMFYLSSDAGGEVRFRQGYAGGQAIWVSQRNTIIEDAWFHVTATFDVSIDTLPRIYVDGEEQTVALSGAAASGMPVSDVGQDVVIGNSDVPDRWFDGRIDELRLERTVRSPAWIEMQYRSMTDTLVAFSPPERLEVSP